MNEPPSEPSDHAVDYRWVVLVAFMAVNLTIQVLWISHAPITGAAADYYGVPDLAIGALATSFMVAFLPLSSHWFPRSQRATSVGLVLPNLSDRESDGVR